MHLHRKLADLITNSTFAAVLGLAALAPALPGQLISPAGTGRFTTQLSQQRSFVFAPNKLGGNHTIWSLVLDKISQRLLLRRTLDDGANWTTVPIPLLNLYPHSYGAIAMGADCETLHLLLTVQYPNPQWSVYYWAFNTTTGLPLGFPQLIAEGVPDGGFPTHYYASDIDVTAKGRVAIVYTSAPPFSGARESFLKVADPTAGAASLGSAVPHSLSPGSMWEPNPNIQTVGETVHTVFHRSVPPSGAVSGIYYRGFDANNMTWNQSAPIEIATDTSKIAHIAADDDCTQCGDSYLYVLYSKGNSTAGGGEIRIRAAKLSDGLPTWEASQLVASEPALLRGNQAYCHYTLAKGPDRRVCAFFSVGNYQSLFVNCYADGAFQLTAPFKWTAIANRFACVNGLRTSHATSNLLVVYSGRNGVGTDEDVRLCGGTTTIPRAIAFGRYTGTDLAQSPRLAAVNAPTPSTGLTLAICEVPPNKPGLLFIGVTCAGQDALLPTPYLPGSYKMQDWLFAVAYATTPCSSNPTRGRAQFSFPIDATLIGACVYFQAVQAFGGPFPLAVTNSVAVKIGV